MVDVATVRRTFYSKKARETQLHFFDRYLTLRDAPERSPMHLEVGESPCDIVEGREEQEWPLARTVWTDLYLSPDGALLTSAENLGRIRFGLRHKAASFTWTADKDVSSRARWSCRRGCP